MYSKKRPSWVSRTSQLSIFPTFMTVSISASAMMYISPLGTLTTA